MSLAGTNSCGHAVDDERTVPLWVQLGCANGTSFDKIADANAAFAICLVASGGFSFKMCEGTPAGLCTEPFKVLDVETTTAV